MPCVTFLPAGRSVTVDPGANLLEAARQCGIRIRNDCGGQGACGRCIVRILSGDGVRLSSRHELAQGEVLACRFLTVESDVSVFVPRSSQEATEDVTVRKAEPTPVEFPPPDALIKTAALDLPPPTLEDNVSDSERLLRGLQGWRPGDYSLPLSVLKELPSTLREANWRAQVTVAVDHSGLSVAHLAGDGQKPPCILAVDVGTTALKAKLLAPSQNWSASCYNSQGIYGPDVISRIIYCQQHEGGLQRMQSLVVGDINRLLTAVLERAGLTRQDVWAVVASGNTTMIHLLAGLHPLWIRREPYVGSCYDLPPLAASQVGLEIHPHGLLYCLPSVASYVGGDITAGVLATGLAERDGPVMLVDLGTNGEIVIGSREFLICCSASAGTAFEGEASASGTRAMPGAIEAVSYRGRLQWETIDNRPPVGICGSGYIDLLAVLLLRGVVDRTGKFQDGSSSCLRKDGYGGHECVLVSAEDAVSRKDIVLTQGDVDNLVRAKGAIYAAASVLLENLGMDWPDLDQIMLAGAFGDKINIENAVRIGLLPDVPRRKIAFVGNTSLDGSVMAALDEKQYVRARRIARQMTYLELSTHPDYMNQFVAARFLPHTEAERFPSVAKALASSGAAAT